MKKKKKPKERNRRGISMSSRIQTLLALSLLVAMAAWPLMAAAAGPRADAGVLDLHPGFALLEVLAIILSILFNGLFVAAETAMDLLRPLHVRAFDKDPVKQESIQRMVNHKATYVAASHLGSQFTRVVMIAMCFMLAPGLARFLEQTWGYPLSWSTLFASGFALSLIVFPVNVILAELVGKSYAASNPAGTSLRLRRFVKFFAIVFRPFIGFFTSVAGLITARFGARASFVITNQAEEEIKTIVESAESSGEIEREEKELLHSVFEFTDTVAREVMTPRVDMDAVSVTTDPAEVTDLIQRSGRSRIPVFEDSDDQIVGVVHVKDLLLAQLRSSYPVTLRALMRPPFFVPENKNLHDLLREMRANRSQLAIVQDEFGGTAGLVTIEDIVEELVGEIIDEYDIEEPEIVPNGTGHIVEGKANLYDLNDAIGSTFESEEFDTIGGYVFGLFGRQPKKDEWLDSDGYRFKIYESDGRRIGKVHVEKLPEELAVLDEGEL